MGYDRRDSNQNKQKCRSDAILKQLLVLVREIEECEKQPGYNYQNESIDQRQRYDPGNQQHANYYQQPNQQPMSHGQPNQQFMNYGQPNQQPMSYGQTNQQDGKHDRNCPCDESNDFRKDEYFQPMTVDGQPARPVLTRPAADQGSGKKRWCPPCYEIVPTMDSTLSCYRPDHMKNSQGTELRPMDVRPPMDDEKRFQKPERDWHGSEQRINVNKDHQFNYHPNEQESQMKNKLGEKRPCSKENRQEFLKPSKCVYDIDPVSSRRVYCQQENIMLQDRHSQPYSGRPEAYKEHIWEGGDGMRPRETERQQYGGPPLENKMHRPEELYRGGPGMNLMQPGGQQYGVGPQEVKIHRPKEPCRGGPGMNSMQPGGQQYGVGYQEPKIHRPEEPYRSGLGMNSMQPGEQLYGVGPQEVKIHRPEEPCRGGPGINSMQPGGQQYGVGPQELKIHRPEQPCRGGTGMDFMQPGGQQYGVGPQEYKIHRPEEPYRRGQDMNYMQPGGQQYGVGPQELKMHRPEQPCRGGTGMNSMQPGGQQYGVGPQEYKIHRPEEPYRGGQGMNYMQTERQYKGDRPKELGRNESGQLYNSVDSFPKAIVMLKPKDDYQQKSYDSSKYYPVLIPKDVVWPRNKEERVQNKPNRFDEPRYQQNIAYGSPSDCRRGPTDSPSAYGKLHHGRPEACHTERPGQRGPRPSGNGGPSQMYKEGSFNNQRRNGLAPPPPAMGGERKGPQGQSIICYEDRVRKDLQADMNWDVYGGQKCPHVHPPESYFTYSCPEKDRRHNHWSPPETTICRYPNTCMASCFEHPVLNNWVYQQPSYRCYMQRRDYTPF